MWEDIAAKCNGEESNQIPQDYEPDYEAALNMTAFIKEEKDTMRKAEGYTEQTGWSEFRKRTQKERYSFIIREFVKYAAIVTIVFSLGYLMNNFVNSSFFVEEHFSSIQIPNTEKGIVNLPDGSVVSLNSGTILRYHDNFAKSREVYLTGEGLFKVKTDPKHPFLVHLDDLTIKVTGTSFNIRSYPDADIETTLIEGNVSILNKNGKILTQLIPDEQALFSRGEKTVSISKVHTPDYTSWEQGKVYLKNKTLEEVTIYLSNWYNASFNFEQEAIKKIRVTGTILTSMPLEQIIKVLKISESLDFDIKEQTDKKSITIRYLK